MQVRIIVLHSEHCTEGSTPRKLSQRGALNIGDNRVVIGSVKRLHLRDELFDLEKKRVHSDRLFLIGRMASPHWSCRTRGRFELIRPD